MKRLTETSKWTSDVWFCELEPKHKLFWLYLIDHCDNVGVWEVNLRVANLLIGYTYPMDTLYKAFEGKIHVFDNGTKWWVRSFIDFQHGQLDPQSTSKPILSYFRLLEKHTLSKEYAKGMDTLQGKGRVRVRVKKEDYSAEFEKAWVEFGGTGNKPSALKFWNKLSAEDRKELTNNIPAYVRSRPDKKFRGHFSSWINPSTKKWKDKIIAENDTPSLLIVVTPDNETHSFVRFVDSSKIADQKQHTPNAVIDGYISRGEWRVSQ